MDKPQVAGTSPCKVELEQGTKYAYCSCGLSANQPFCDGQHKGTEFRPIVFEAESSETVFFCTCKQTSNGAYCDGTHKTLCDADSAQPKQQESSSDDIV